MRCVFVLRAAGVGEDVSNLRLQVQERMDVKDRYRDLQFSFGEEGKGDQVPFRISGGNLRIPPRNSKSTDPNNHVTGRDLSRLFHVLRKLSHDHI